MATQQIPSCNECLKVTIDECDSSIEMILGFTENAAYRMTDKFGNVYTGDAILSYDTTNIDLSVLPEMLVNSHAGAFTIQFFDEDNDLIEITIDDKTYQCVELTAVPFTAVSEG